MEYSPAAKINKSPKEKKALIEAPPMKARSLYAQEYAKKAKTINQSKGAMEQAYNAVEKKHGKGVRDSLKAYHDANYNDNDGLKRGGSASKKNSCW
jgi:hypothetical protein